MVPRLDAVLFDLFGTIVAPYRRHEHHDALGEVATVLDVGFDELSARWEETWDDRTTGRIESIADNLRAIVPEAPASRIAEADRTYERFTRQSLIPKAGALEVLDWLAERDVATALVTNCAPDVPHVWDRTQWASRFDATVFSCLLGTKKPDPLMYRTALDALGVEADRAVFVGDGSDDELPGAAAVGLTPVLVRNDPDAADPEVVAAAAATGWAVVDHLSELPRVLDRFAASR